MQRREYLLGVAVGLGTLTGGTAPASAREVTPAVRAAVRAARRPPAAVPSLPVPQSDLVLGGPRGSIPAITQPAYAPDWRDVDRSLEDRDLVIGVERGDLDRNRNGARARAYPLALLETHEVVNATLDGPLLVTYCPLCASGVVAERSLDGDPVTFSASGYLYRGDLVLYDHATGSLWSQLLATAIRGPATGDQLALVPSSLTTWGRWRDARPDTEVLLPPPASGTVTAPLDPVPPAGSGASGHVGVADVALDVDDDRLPVRELVVGVTARDVARAYPLSAVRSAGAINDWVGDLPVVVAADPVPQAYARVVDGTVPVFEQAGDGRIRGAGSTWSLATGRALTGHREGAVLPRAAATTAMYWFAWLDFHPKTTVFGLE